MAVHEQKTSNFLGLYYTGRPSNSRLGLHFHYVERNNNRVTSLMLTICFIFKNHHQQQSFQCPLKKVPGSAFAYDYTVLSICSRLFSRSCAVCNFYCFGRQQVLKTSQNLVTLTKQWKINNVHNDKKILKRTKNFYPEKRDICKTLWPTKRVRITHCA